MIHFTSEGLIHSPIMILHIIFLFHINKSESLFHNQFYKNFIAYFLIYRGWYLLFSCAFNMSMCMVV